ncbi:predicted protein [Uncinocarpus reesii 1704]|uniref:mitogen-activated protein kinase n=1 Tax=Uncinocarpus reesii (strain UAMH 1704) TaxID=336963 RepID=C4JQ65_UNCRE|nr:uncharacterized protein UREG_03298 [Uncinocarpus reesii 1704]EEP78452.1 predicted protein [Uncinocarpus reesii 1704]
MLRDSSIDHSTHVFGKDAVRYQHGRERRIVVAHGLNTMFGIGSGRAGTVQFVLLWHGDAEETMAKVMARKREKASKYGDRYRFPSPDGKLMFSSVRRSEGQARTIRFVKTKNLGSGQFGEVFKALDVDTGKLMAVKQLKTGKVATEAERLKKLQQYQLLEREMHAIRQARHPNIIEYLGSQGWGGGNVKIFTSLKDGDLVSLIQAGEDAEQVARRVLCHMLRALDYLACIEIIHRDVKPDNILYTFEPNGRAVFILTDFGCSSRANTAKSIIGTRIYMAPEMSMGGLQTPKVDVWSLFVTMMWILDVHGFRALERRITCAVEIQQIVAFAAATPWLSGIQEMAAPDPLHRASAAQMLVGLYGGKGLTTPVDRIPPMLGRRRGNHHFVF